MIKIDDATIEKLEILAKLELEEKEKKRTIEEMEKLLAYAEKLNELDTDEIEPLPYCFADGNVFREDTVTNPDGKEAALFNAPKQKDGQFAVPKTV